MILNGGRFAGRQYLSTAAVHEMTRNQLSGKALQSCQEYLRYIHHPADLNGNGLGWATNSSGKFGHEGAYATNLRIDPSHDLATIWLVQYAGVPGGPIDTAESDFEEAATRRFIEGR